MCIVLPFAVRHRTITTDLAEWLVLEEQYRVDTRGRDHCGGGLISAACVEFSVQMLVSKIVQLTLRSLVPVFVVT